MHHPQNQLLCTVIIESADQSTLPTLGMAIQSSNCEEETKLETNPFYADATDEQTTKYYCLICEKKLGSKLSLSKHKILFHSSADKLFCNVCGRLFSEMADRDAHCTQDSMCN